GPAAGFGQERSLPVGPSAQGPGTLQITRPALQETALLVEKGFEPPERTRGALQLLFLDLAGRHHATSSFRRALSMNRCWMAMPWAAARRIRLQSRWISSALTAVPVGRTRMREESRSVLGSRSPACGK